MTELAFQRHRVVLELWRTSRFACDPTAFEQQCVNVVRPTFAATPCMSTALCSSYMGTQWTMYHTLLRARCSRCSTARTQWLQPLLSSSQRPAFADWDALQQMHASCNICCLGCSSRKLCVGFLPCTPGQAAVAPRLARCRLPVTTGDLLPPGKPAGRSMQTAEPCRHTLLMTQAASW